MLKYLSFALFFFCNSIAFSAQTTDPPTPITQKEVLVIHLGQNAMSETVVSIHDALGRKVKNTNITNQNKTINFDLLDPGIYIVKISSPKRGISYLRVTN